MNYSKIKASVLKTILMNAELVEYKIDENLTVLAENLEMDSVIFDVDKNPLMNAEFVFEGKEYKTGENGEITEIEDAVKVEIEAEEEVPADTVAIQAELDEANKRIEELETENQSLKAELVSVKEEAVALAKQPKVESINMKNEFDAVPARATSPLDAIKKALNTPKK